MNCNQLQLFNNMTIRLLTETTDESYYRSDVYRQCDEAWNAGYDAYTKFKAWIGKDFIAHWESGWFDAAQDNGDWFEMERMITQWVSTDTDPPRSRND